MTAFLPDKMFCQFISSLKIETNRPQDAAAQRQIRSPIYLEKHRSRMQRGRLTVKERIRTQLIGMGRRKHQRLDGDGNDFGDAQAFADIDIIQVADFDAVDSDDIPRHMTLIFENAAERLGDIEVQGLI